jgi:DNA modification methylase
MVNSLNKKVIVKKAEATCSVINGDSRVKLSALTGQADLIVTSPPYADARRKHYEGVHPDEYVEWFLSFHEPFFNVLKPSGSLVLNIKDKVVNGVRHRYVWHTIEALCARGWFSIDDYLWHKTNPMPGYWPTRLRDGWEYCFHLAKSNRPYFNPDGVRKPIGEWVESRLSKLGQNDLSRHNSVNESGFGRDISKWVGKETVLPSNVLSSDAPSEEEFTLSNNVPSNVISRALVGKNKGHPAVFPVDLPLFFIKLLCPENGLVIDPFGGSGTTGIAALSLGRNCVLIDNNEQYCEEAVRRLCEEAEGQREGSALHQSLYKA